MMNKRIAAVLILLLLGSYSAFAQQLTRFAVVDLNKVYSSFFRDSRAVREWEERSARVQADIDRMTAEIQTLKSNQVSAEARGDQSQASRLQSEIARKTETLNDYFRVKTAELEERRGKLLPSGSFLQQMDNEIRYIAESEGYSMVLSLKDNKGIVWYSPSVDITNKLIQNLRAKVGR
jgi:outer membrane protein